MGGFMGLSIIKYMYLKILKNPNKKSIQHKKSKVTEMNFKWRL